MRILTFFAIAWKRIWKNPLFLVMLGLLCFCVLFFGSIEKEVRMAPVGVVLRDSDPEAVRLYDMLVADGFVPFSQEQAMCEAIRDEKISIGIAIREGLTPRLEAGDVEGVLVLYCMPTASFVRVTSLRLSAHLGEIYAPYMTERMMEQIGVELSHEQVRAHMEECFRTDAQFTFTMTDIAGKPLERTSYSRSLILGMLAVLLFCLFSLCTCTEKDASYRQLHDRLGAKKAFLTVLLPGYALRYLIAMVVCALASIACRQLYGTDISGLWWRCAIYLAYLLGISALLYAVLYRFGRVQLYVLTLSLLSLGVCPIFVDISAFVKIPEWIRLLIPPYYFYKIPQAPLPCALGAVAACGAGLTALYLRERRITPRTRV